MTTTSHGHRPVDSRVLAVLTVNRTRAGKVRGVRELVDMSTGEILDPASLGIQHVNKAERCQSKRAVFEELRPEVQRFATFVLKFRNNRRGITPGINTLCHWYAELHGLRADNVRRYIEPLRRAEILASENALGPLWQLAGGTSKGTLSEESEASARFLLMRIRAQVIPDMSALSFDQINQLSRLYPEVLQALEWAGSPQERRPASYLRRGRGRSPLLRGRRQSA